MAVSETDTSDCNSDSSVDGSKQGDRKDRLFTKIVVRRLPPSMNKESFVNQVSPLPDFDYMYFVKADMSLGEFAFSRAYINFRNPTDIFIFKEKFDNYVFLDAKGNEYTAVVEFAPFSRIPKKRNKTRCDPKIGTIESDPLYSEFVESLNEVTNETEEKPEYCFQPSPEDDKKVVNTPLLDFIKQRRLDRQKIREEKREDRKRREIERKRIKEEERKGRKRIEHVGHTTTKIATKQTLDVIDENKLESSPKGKDKRIDDYRSRGGKVNTKDYTDKRAPYASKDRTMEQRKSPSKIRQRERSQTEKEPRRTEYKSKRDETRHRKDDKTAEKKVKKYSERREERRSEFKKQETKSESNTDKIDTEKPKAEIKLEDNKKEGDESMFLEEKEKEERVYSDTEPPEHVKEHFKGHRDREHREHRDREHRDRDHDPRTQRRIRNKDRPTMAIYQPGQFRKKRPTDNSDDGQKCSGSDTTTKSQ